MDVTSKKKWMSSKKNLPMKNQIKYWLSENLDRLIFKTNRISSSLEEIFFCSIPFKHFKKKLF